MDKTNQLIIKTIITFFILFIYTRLLGKKQMSQLTYFNYITGLVIGTITASTIFQTDYSFYQGMMVLTLWCLLTAIIGILTFKIQGLKSLINGNPTIVVKNGKLLKKALSKERLTLEDLKLMLREQKIFTIREIDYAILEHNGKLSVLKNVLNQNVTKEDMKIIAPNPLYIPTEVIINGHLLRRNIRELQITENFIFEELKKLGVKSIKDVMYAELDELGTLYIEMD